VKKFHLIFQNFQQCGRRSDTKAQPATEPKAHPVGCATHFSGTFRFILSRKFHYNIVANKKFSMSFEKWIMVMFENNKNFQIYIFLPFLWDAQRFMTCDKGFFFCCSARGCCCCFCCQSAGNTWLHNFCRDDYNLVFRSFVGGESKKFRPGFDLGRRWRCRWYRGMDQYFGNS